MREDLIKRTDANVWQRLMNEIRNNAGRGFVFTSSTGCHTRAPVSSSVDCCANVYAWSVGSGQAGEMIRKFGDDQRNMRFLFYLLQSESDALDLSHVVPSLSVLFASHNVKRRDIPDAGLEAFVDRQVRWVYTAVTNCDLANYKSFVIVPTNENTMSTLLVSVLASTKNNPAPFVGRLVITKYDEGEIK